MSDSLQPHRPRYPRLLCPSLSSSRVCSGSCPLSRWCYLILCHSLLLLPSIFPSTRVFSSESALRIRWPKYGASTSAEVLAVSIQGWFPLGWTGLVSADQGTLKSLLQHHNSKASIFLVLSLLYSPTLTSVHDYWKNHSSNYMELCQQSDVSSF